MGSRAGLDGRKTHPHRDSIPDRPDRSQSLYRLNYPAHNIKIYLQKVGYEDIDWIELSQDGDSWGGTHECGNEPSGSIKCREFLG